VWSLAVSPSGRFVLSGGSDKIIRCWDMKNRQNVQTFPHHSGAVVGLAFPPRGARFVSCSNDGSLCLWNLPGVKGNP
jgi:WD40 repeat protein